MPHSRVTTLHLRLNTMFPGKVDDPVVLERKEESDLVGRLLEASRGSLQRGIFVTHAESFAALWLGYNCTTVGGMPCLLLIRHTIHYIVLVVVLRPVHRSIFVVVTWTRWAAWQKGLKFAALMVEDYMKETKAEIRGRPFWVILKFMYLPRGTTGHAMEDARFRDVWKLHRTSEAHHELVAGVQTTGNHERKTRRRKGAGGVPENSLDQGPQQGPRLVQRVAVCMRGACSHHPEF